MLDNVSQWAFFENQADVPKLGPKTPTGLT